jgi:metal-dependent amidase/aminoacylase/carboxypeptidase family protein
MPLDPFSGMNALPINKDTDFPFALQIPLVIHACGHDAKIILKNGKRDWTKIALI